MKVYDLLGREVATLVHEYLNAGSYETTFSATDGSASPKGVLRTGGDATGLASGVYFYRLQARPIHGGQAGEFVQTKKLVVQK